MFGIGLGINASSAPLREFYTGLHLRSIGIFDQLSILNDDQKSNWMGFEHSDTSSFHYRGVDYLTTHLLPFYFSHHWESGPRCEAQIGWGFIEGFGKSWCK